MKNIVLGLILALLLLGAVCFLYMILSSGAAGVPGGYPSHRLTIENKTDQDLDLSSNGAFFVKPTGPFPRHRRRNRLNGLLPRNEKLVIRSFITCADEPLDIRGLRYRVLTTPHYPTAPGKTLAEFFVNHGTYTITITRTPSGDLECIKEEIFD